MRLSCPTRVRLIKESYTPAKLLKGHCSPAMLLKGHYSPAMLLIGPSYPASRGTYLPYFFAMSYWVSSWWCCGGVCVRGCCGGVCVCEVLFSGCCSMGLGCMKGGCEGGANVGAETGAHIALLSPH